MAAPVMSPKLQAEIARACEIAERDHMVVVSTPVKLVGARRAWRVTRRTTGTVHTVHEVSGRLVCDAECTASQHSRYCAHRGAVRTYEQERRVDVQTYRDMLNDYPAFPA